MQLPNKQPGDQPGTIDDRIRAIKAAIEGGARYGTYGEGQISVANQELEKLRNELAAGQLSQADFVNITKQFAPAMYDTIARLSGGGSASANAARAAGGDKFLADYWRDYNIYTTAQDVLKRDVTANEINELRPYFSGPNGLDSGRAAISHIADQEAKSPEALSKKAPEYSGKINEIYQDLLKRGASSDELDYFGQKLATGEITPYEVREWIKQTGDYQTQEDTKFRTSLADELAGYDQKAFDEQKQNILSSYMKSGKLNSTALDYAITDTLSKMATNRDQFLSSLSASQYQGNKAAARGDYETSLSRLFGKEDYNQQKNDTMLSDLLKRANEGVDYQREMSDLVNYMNAQPKQDTSPWNYVNAGLGLLNTGANVGRLFI